MEIIARALWGEGGAGEAGEFGAAEEESALKGGAGEEAGFGEMAGKESGIGEATAGQEERRAGGD